ncbi:MAG: hypothetical protein DWQ47_00160 [Acidobacteria bacterium]|nr:MAG: hypothetical protein DWQ32_10620 [Acidobacteriota bacterium]REK03925.1 MAG: hypothetical protein DWQ38_00145 [Acidobacteriota bacterium]REK15087.1 MAG: hypothetical protein DWQ43_16310 [Acidobacteriota bacterium]REK46177.1 MAG: hypothetical protein DWQ47_00160 [Acidobacteriota bacterium]
MIKSLLDDDDPHDEEEDRKKRRRRGFRRKDDFLSIGLSDSSEESEKPGETVEDIRQGILGISDPAPRTEAEPDSGRPSTESTDTPYGGSFKAPEESALGGDAPELDQMLLELEKELEKEKASESREALQGVHRLPPSTAAPEPAVPDLEIDYGAKPASSYAGSTESDNLGSVEVFRRTGLAWSAAIALFGSVVFMLAIGWVADVLLGTAPWGIVVGIVIGALIGFLQFFRMTSQILKPSSGDFDRLSLRAAAPNSEAPEAVPEQTPEDVTNDEEHKEADAGN